MLRGDWRLFEDRKGKPGEPTATDRGRVGDCCPRPRVRRVTPLPNACAAGWIATEGGSAILFPVTFGVFPTLTISYLHGPNGLIYAYPYIHRRGCAVITTALHTRVGLA